MIADTLARQLQLQRHYAPAGTFLGGIPVDEMAQTDTILFAGLHADHLPLDIAPEQVLPADTIGMLAPDIMQNYDIEFDFAAGKMNVFNPHPCAGKAVYWTHGNYAQVPIKLDSIGHITVPVTLDGKTLTAAVDTGAEGSVMSLDALEDIFGVDASNPALISIGDRRVNGLANTPTYRYPFSTLVLEGVQVGKPDIIVLKTPGYHHGLPDLVLGIETLRQLHLYIAYQEGDIYLTPAEQR